ncbi:MAG: sugar ABC transporter substrate-binding protein, partial [Actinomycetota bacterium]
MKKPRLVLSAIIAAFALILTGCGSSDDASSDGFVGVILPDAASSARWETADRGFLQAAFDAAGVKADIQNANGDKEAFQTIADQMLSAGAKVLILVNLDSESAKAVQ